MVKNGGNVVTYFCTPEGRLIHAVGGPVNSTRLLSEARWAADTFAQMQLDKRQSMVETLREAHQIASSTSSTRHINRGWEKSITSEQARVHRLLQKYAYTPMAQVESTLFRSLSGESFETDRTAIFNATKAFAQAEKRNRPVLLVLGSKRNARWASNSSARSGAIDHPLKSYQAKRYLRKFAVVHVPKIQLAAFTNLKELKGWDRFEANDSSWQYGDTYLLVHPSGEILSQLDIHNPHSFAEQLKSALETWEQRVNTNDLATQP